MQRCSGQDQTVGTLVCFELADQSVDTQVPPGEYRHLVISLRGGDSLAI